MDMFTSIIIAFFALLFLSMLIYTLRTSGERERELISHKDKLVSLLECYSTSLERIAGTLQDIERRLERMEGRELIRVGGIQAEGSQVRTGRDAVGRDVQTINIHNAPGEEKASNK